MTFLELVKQLRQECSVAGTGPATVIAQVGEMKRLVDWTKFAWIDIQNSRPDWMFLRNDFSFNTVASLGDYTPSGVAGVGAALADFREWHRDTFRVYSTATGVSSENYILEWDYQDLRNMYRFGTPIEGLPVVFAIKPKDSSIMFGSIPDGIYTCRGEYQRRAVTLALDADEPEIDETMHMAIVYRAMIAYGLEQGAPEVKEKGELGLAKLMAVIEDKYLPKFAS